MSDAVDFFNADKHESLLHIDIKIFWWEMVKHSQNFQNSKYAMSLQEVRDEVKFLDEYKHQRFLQVDFNTLGIKVSYKVILSLLMGIIKHYQRTQK